MNVGLTAGFGTLIGVSTLATLKAHGWTIMRIGKQVAQPTPLPLLIAEVQTAGLEALVYCDSTQVGDLTPGILGAEVTHPIAFARGTEPVGLPLRPGASSYDLQLDAAAFAETVNAAVPTLKAKGIPAWTCMTSLDQSTLAWTAAVPLLAGPRRAVHLHLPDHGRPRSLSCASAICQHRDRRLRPDASARERLEALAGCPGRRAVSDRPKPAPPMCPKCGEDRAIEKVSGSVYFCNICSHTFVSK